MPMLFRTDDVPPAERFERFREVALKGQIPITVDSGQPDDFRATWGSARLGEVSVTSIACCAPFRFRRTPKLIRESDPEAYRLVLNIRGNNGVTQHRRHAGLEPGDLALYETSSPWEGWRGSGSTPIEWVMVTFPRRLLPIPPRTVSPLLGRRMTGQDGISALIGTMLHGLIDNVHQYRPADRLRLSQILLDLLTALLHRQLENTDSESAESSRRTLLLRIRSFIQNNLDDPALSPRMIAAAHHISTRQLHRLFEGQDMTVAAWIRDRRLEHARQDLIDPAQRSRPIRLIAARWGFSDAALFSRSFAAAHGVSPRDYRRRHQTDRTEA